MGDKTAIIEFDYILHLKVSSDSLKDLYRRVWGKVQELTSDLPMATTRDINTVTVHREYDPNSGTFIFMGYAQVQIQKVHYV